MRDLFAADRLAEPTDCPTRVPSHAASEWEVRVAALTRVNQDDLMAALGLESAPLLEPLLRRAGRATARRFAEAILRADAAVGERGLQRGCEWGLGAFQTALRVVGAESVPAEGPLLFVANHPGMADTLALFAAIPRTGLRTIAARRPFLEQLPNLSAPLIWVDEGSTTQRGVIRAAVRTLREGGVVLTFPGGAIEPDPAVSSGLDEALDQWNSSIDLMARLTPGLRIVPTLISGVVSARAAHSPLRLLRRSEEGRALLGAMLQLALPAYRAVTATVRFGPPIDAAALPSTGNAVTRAAVAAMRRLLAEEQADPR